MNYTLISFHLGLYLGGVSLLAPVDIFSHFRVMPHCINLYLVVSRYYAFITRSNLLAESSIRHLDQIIIISMMKLKAMG
jgi:hypothetical protein